MRGFVQFAFVAILLAGASYGLFYALDKQQETARKPLQTEYRYNRLSDGTIVIQEVPASPLEELEPAAGDGTENGPFPKYQYDPLTQTFRAQ